MISKVSAIVGGILGALFGIGLFGLVSVVYFLPQAREEGRELERAATLQKSIETIQKRSKTNAEIRNLSASALCLELGGVFSDGECH